MIVSLKNEIRVTVGRNTQVIPIQGYIGRSTSLKKRPENNGETQSPERLTLDL
jgi:hypothetical protein